MRKSKTVRLNDDYLKATGLFKIPIKAGRGGELTNRLKDILIRYSELLKNIKTGLNAAEIEKISAVIDIKSFHSAAALDIHTAIMVNLMEKLPSEQELIKKVERLPVSSVTWLCEEIERKAEKRS